MDDAGLDALIAAARDVRSRAYAPYSGFGVAAAAFAGGATYLGVNVENASSPVGVCAERVALGAMVTAGERTLEAIAIVTDAAEPTPPCGTCRQALWEFGPEALVVAETLAGLRRVWRLVELLPFPFERGSR
jgi:cytidine deaminase